MAGLDRRYFSVVLLCIVNSDATLSPDVLASIDERFDVPLLKAEGDKVLLYVLLQKYVQHTLAVQPRHRYLTTALQYN